MGGQGFFRSDNILFTLWTGADLLLVLKPFDRVDYLFKLERGLSADENRVNYTCWTDRLSRLDIVRYSFGWDVLIVNVLLMIAVLRISRRVRRRWFRIGSGCWPRIVPFGCWPEVASIAFLSLRDQFIELCLQINEQSAQFCIAVERFLQLLREPGNDVGRFSELRLNRRQAFVHCLVFFSKSEKFLAG